MNRFANRTQQRMRGAWRRALCGVGVIALAAAASPAALAQTLTISFDIESQPLASALLVLGRQADLSILAPTSLTNGKTAPQVRGEHSASAALDQLLAGSGLRYEFVRQNAVRIVAGDRADLAPAVSPPAHDGEPTDRVVVTGTTIAGVSPAGSPIEVYTAQDIARSGATTTEQFVGKLTQNLGSTSQYAVGSTTAGPNYDGVTAIDLRGLGVGTTLTLLNGRRMALSNSGQSADVSMIPASMIARVEVLTDGASAIYGSDAIGGVVNFVLRDDFEGAETRLSYGGTTSGGFRQGGASQVFGTSWESGRGLISYNYQSTSALKRTDRDYSAPSGRGTLTPIEARHNLLAATTHDLNDRLTLDAQIGFGQRKVKNEVSNLVNPFLVQNIQTYRSETEQYFADLSLDYDITPTWNVSVGATYSEVAVDGQRSLSFFNRVPRPAPALTDFGTRNTILETSAKVAGNALALPGGDLRVSMGGGVLAEEFSGYSPISTLQSAGTLGRTSPYAFLELFAPFVEPEQRIPLVRRLELSLAARYTDYQDNSSPALGREFGDSIDPKIGVLWEPQDFLGLRATYGTSFRVPSLTQLDPTGGSHFLTTTTIGGVPNSYFLGVSGYAVPELGPETATTYTVGFDMRMPAAPDFRIAGTYYNIDYTNRIGQAPFGGLNPFLTPQLLPEVIYRPPSAAFIEEQLRATALSVNTTGVNLSDPAAAAQALFALPDMWIYDVRYKNLALSRQDGIDVSASYQLETPVGEAYFKADVTHILNYQQQESSTASVRTAVDIPGSPVDWRGRLQAGVSNGGFNGTVSVNYADAYANPSAPADQRRIDDWTTVDVSVSYQFGGESPATGNGPILTLSAQNILDEDPPFLRTGTGSNILFPIGFDPANANPLGRFITLGFTYKW